MTRRQGVVPGGRLPCASEPPFGLRLGAVPLGDDINIHTPRPDKRATPLLERRVSNRVASEACSWGALGILCCRECPEPLARL